MLDVACGSVNGLDLGKSPGGRSKASFRKALCLYGFTSRRCDRSGGGDRNAVDDCQIKFFVAVLVVMVVRPASLAGELGLWSRPQFDHAVRTLVARQFAGINLAGFRWAPYPALGLLVRRRHSSRSKPWSRMEEGGTGSGPAGYAWSHTAGALLAGTLVPIHRPNADWLARYIGRHTSEETSLGRLHLTILTCGSFCFFPNIYPLPGA